MVIEQAAHRTEVVCLPGSRQFTLLDVAASVGQGEVKLINHRDETIVKTKIEVFWSWNSRHQVSRVT